MVAPLRDLVNRASTGWSPLARQKLRSTVANGTWTQSRAFDRWLTDRQQCLACGGPRTIVRHLVWRCDATAGLRRAADVDGELALAQADDAEDLLWSRDLLACPLARAPVRLQRLQFVAGGPLIHQQFATPTAPSCSLGMPS